MKAKCRVCGERGSAKMAYTKLVHQKYLPRSSEKVCGFLLQSVFLLATIPGNVHEWPRVPRISWTGIGSCKTLSVHPSNC